MNDAVAQYRKKVDPRLQMRQRIFFCIICILLIIAGMNVWQGKMSLILAVSGFLLSTICGLALTRMFKIFWHTKKRKVMYQLDAIGTLLLAIYIVIEIEKDWFFGYWLSGESLSAFCLLIVTGFIFGRFLGTFFKIHVVLTEEAE